jgi:hypothetical protein
MFTKRDLQKIEHIVETVSKNPAHAPFWVRVTNGEVQRHFTHRQFLEFLLEWEEYPMRGNISERDKNEFRSRHFEILESVVRQSQKSFLAFQDDVSCMKRGILKEIDFQRKNNKQIQGLTLGKNKEKSMSNGKVLALSAGGAPAVVSKNVVDGVDLSPQEANFQEWSAERFCEEDWLKRYGIASLEETAYHDEGGRGLEEKFLPLASNEEAFDEYLAKQMK